jgi:hypothetical protein
MAMAGSSSGHKTLAHIPANTGKIARTMTAKAAINGARTAVLSSLQALIL